VNMALKHAKAFSNGMGMEMGMGLTKLWINTHYCGTSPKYSILLYLGFVRAHQQSHILDIPLARLMVY